MPKKVELIKRNSELFYKFVALWSKGADIIT